MRLLSTLMWIALASPIQTSTTSALALPNRLCQIKTAIRTDARTLATTPSSDQTIYRFAEDKLFLRPTDQSEYFYGVLSATEGDERRFIVGNKLIVFDSAEARDGFVVHTDQLEVRVVRLRCA